jgi:hypothetical protein
VPDWPRLRPSAAAAAYTVGDALEDWLAHGVDGLSARTVTLYRGTIVKALTEKLGAIRLTALTARDVHGALTAMASRLSTRTVQIDHNVLVRAIRQAERDNLVGRNVAALAGTPKEAQGGRPPKSLTLEQAAALIAATKGTRLEAYIIVSLLSAHGVFSVNDRFTAPTLATAVAGLMSGSSKTFSLPFSCSHRRSPAACGRP